MINILILASGGGSNARAVVEYIQKSKYKMVVNMMAACNVREEKAAVYGRMKKLGVNTAHIPSPGQDFSSLRFLLDFGFNGLKFDLIVMAGYMRIIPADIAEEYNILNIHPSVLPFAHKGSMDAYKDAFAAGSARTGCTVHRVIPEVDAGPVLAQIGFDIPDEIMRAGDLDLLKQVGLAHEHALYPEIALREAADCEEPLDMWAVQKRAQNILLERRLPFTNTLIPGTGAVFKIWNQKGR
ncbi:MAG: hypothetical protein LBH81_01870 [Rickettsiales bacterium]|jgi:phosphoribosylglycinamide formyltransferase-1|nr:hypothetical protein [Rickettsiales bacterium]